jgi:DNA-binding PadR family transcriptional regulator
LKQGFGLRILILKVLEYEFFEKNSLTAYEIQSKIYKMTFSFWKPSPGSIYPVLEELSEKGFTKIEKRENKDYYTLTQKGVDTFHQILSYKLFTDLCMNTLLYDKIDPSKVNILTEIPQLNQQMDQMTSMVGSFAEQQGIELEKISEHISRIEKEIQKEKISEIVEGIDKYIQLLGLFKEKFSEQLDVLNLDTI